MLASKTDGTLCRMGSALVLGLIVVTGCQQTTPLASSQSQLVPTHHGEIDYDPVIDQPAAMSPDQAWAQAESEIFNCAQSEDPFVRANAVETGQWIPDRVAELVHMGLRDQHEAVRFSAAVLVGRLKLEGMVASVKELGGDASVSVRAAILYALQRCDEPVDLSPMATILFQSDPTVRGNAAMLLGQLGDPSAIPMLSSAAKSPLPHVVTSEQEAVVRIQIAEAIVNLGDESAIEVVRAQAYAQSEEVRIMAVRMLGRLRDRRFERALVAMLDQNPIERRLAAAESLVRLGNTIGLEQILAGCRIHLPTVRAQAALALGLFTSDRAVEARMRMLQDPSQQVRLAAAAAIFQASQSEASPGNRPGSSPDSIAATPVETTNAATAGVTTNRTVEP